MFQKVLLILFLVSCSSPEKSVPKAVPVVKDNIKEFSRGELILATQLLTKIFDGEMSPLECVPDRDEASLLLRTIHPRMEIVEDDIEAQLDRPGEVDELIKTCDQNCTCGHIDDLFREHQVQLSKNQKKILNAKKNDKELNKCLNYEQTTFCQGELYKTLEKEKADFSFEEGI